MALPQIITEIAWAANPGDSSYVWTNISSDVKSVQYSRGRNAQLNVIQAGTSVVTLKNLSRQYEPGYSGGSNYPNVIPMKPIRVRAVIGGVSHTLFQHFVSSWPITQTGATYAEAQITGVDGFEMLTNNIIPGSSSPFAEELSGTRITHVLNAVSWSSSLRNISTGNTKAQSYTFTDLDKVNALAHIQTIVQLEAGLFFMDGSGNAVFLDRTTLQASPYSVSQLTISDRSADVPGVAAVAYASSKPSYDKTLIVNDWQIVPTTNAAYPSLVLEESVDSASQTSYFPRPSQITVPFISNGDGLSLAQYLVFQYKQPLLRHDSIVIKPGSGTTAWTHVATRELGDRITVIAHPPGGGSAYDVDERIQWINVTIPTDVSQTTCEWATYPASLGNFLTLDDANLGQLSANNCFAY